MKFRTLKGHLPWNRWMDGAESVVVLLPFCHRHRFFPLWWPITSSILFALPWAVVLFVDAMEPYVDFRWVVAALLIDFLLLVYLKLRSLQVRAARIGALDFVLIGLSEEFVRGCEAMDDREAEQVGDSLAQLEEFLSAPQDSIGDSRVTLIDGSPRSSPLQGASDARFWCREPLSRS